MHVEIFDGFYVIPQTRELATGEFDLPQGGRAWIEAGLIHRDPANGPAMVDMVGTKHYVVRGVTQRVVHRGQTEVESKYKITVRN